MKKQKTNLKAPSSLTYKERKEFERIAELIESTVQDVDTIALSKYAIASIAYLEVSKAISKLGIENAPNSLLQERRALNISINQSIKQLGLSPEARARMATVEVIEDIDISDWGT